MCRRGDGTHRRCTALPSYFDLRLLIIACQVAFDLARCWSRDTIRRARAFRSEKCLIVTATQVMTRMTRIQRIASAYAFCFVRQTAVVVASPALDRSRARSRQFAGLCLDRRSVTRRGLGCAASIELSWRASTRRRSPLCWRRESVGDLPPVRAAKLHHVAGLPDRQHEGRRDRQCRR